LVLVFTEGHVFDVMQTVFDVPVPADPGLQVDRQSLSRGK
jgi:hypothetical protein